MTRCPVCSNDTFEVKELTDGRLLICSVCGEDTWDDECDYKEDEQYD